MFFSTCVFSQGIEGFESLYISGYKVNIREKPSLDAKVRFQANWGDEYLAIKVNDNWVKINSWDGSKYYYVHADYIKQKDEFFQAALNLEQRNPKTEILLIDYFLDLNKIEEATDIAIKWINKSPSETIYLGFEKCALVSLHAYLTISAHELDSVSQYYLNKRLYKEVVNKKILNLIELKTIEQLIRNKAYQWANKKLFFILTNTSDDLRILNGCDYDSYGKTYPQVWFKNLFFINYHLSSLEERSEILNDLKAIINDESLTEKSKSMAIDISSKLNFVWNID